MPKDPMRRFAVLISSTSGGPAYEHHVDAAYWQVGNNADSIHDHYRDNLVAFKDHDGKPVFAVRGDLVETITEIRDAAAHPGALCACGAMGGVITASGGTTVHLEDCPRSVASRAKIEEAAA